MKLLTAVIVKRKYASDHVSIETDLTNPHLHDDSDPHLWLAFTCPKDTAEFYLSVNFPELSIREIVKSGGL